MHDRDACCPSSKRSKMASLASSSSVSCPCVLCKGKPVSSKKVRAAHMKICHSSLKNVEISDQDASDEPTVDDLDAIVEHDGEIGYSQYANVRNIVVSLSFTFSVFTLSSFILISDYSLLIIDHKNAAVFPPLNSVIKKRSLANFKSPSFALFRVRGSVVVVPYWSTTLMRC